VLTMLFEKIEQLNQKELEDGEFEFNYIFMRNTKYTTGEKLSLPLELHTGLKK